VITTKANHIAWIKSRIIHHSYPVIEDLFQELRRSHGRIRCGLGSLPDESSEIESGKPIEGDGQNKNCRIEFQNHKIYIVNRQFSSVGSKLKIEHILAVLLVGLLLAPPAIGQKSANELVNEGNDLSHNKAQYEESLKLFDEAITLEPNNAGAWDGKGYLFIYLGRYKDAMNCYDKCLELNPEDPWYWDCKGYVHNYLGEFEEALKCYDKSLERDPTYSFALANKGWTLFWQGNYEKAIYCFDTAVKTNVVPEWSGASEFSGNWAGQGLALRALGKNDEAKNCFDQALKSSDMEMKKLPLMCVYAWNGRGLALYGLGRFDEAIACFEKALELDPRFAACWYWKGLAHLDLNQNSDAKLSFEKAKEIGLGWPILSQQISK
jgi:tetratricopeptide (TPR) repeat protein